jgi:hypothetical protein
VPMVPTAAPFLRLAGSLGAQTRNSYLAKPAIRASCKRTCMCRHSHKEESGIMRNKTKRRRYRYCMLLLSAMCYAAVLPTWAVGQTGKKTVDTAAASSALAVHVRLGEGLGGTPQMEAELENLTGMTITAYKVVSTTLYSDGREIAGGWTEDLVNIIGIVEAFPETTFQGDNPGFLGPGETRIYKQFILKGPGGTAPVQVVGTAAGVIYKDRTAVGDPGFIKSEFALRRQAADDMAAVIAEMEGILSDGEIHDAVIRQGKMSEVTNIPSAEQKFRQQLGERIGSLNQGSPADRRHAQELRLHFYDASPLLVVRNALDAYKAEQAAYAASSIRQEAQ